MGCSELRKEINSLTKKELADWLEDVLDKRASKIVDTLHNSSINNDKIKELEEKVTLWKGKHAIESALNRANKEKVESHNDQILINQRLARIAFSGHENRLNVYKEYSEPTEANSPE